MKKTLLLITLIASALLGQAQSKTTERLEKQYEDSFKLFFYQNTLRMINQKEDAEFDELISGIEKMKLLILRKEQRGFDYAKIKKAYHKESFEEIMSSRHEGKSFDMMIREKDGKTKAMLVLVNDEDNLFVLDILGSVPLNKVTKLYSEMDKNSEVARSVKNFINRDKDKSDADEE